MDQLKNRFRMITKDIGYLFLFHTHYNHIVQENPSGVPEEDRYLLDPRKSRVENSSSRSYFPSFKIKNNL
jgi:hypothetical protein